LKERAEHYEKNKPEILKERAEHYEKNKPEILKERAHYYEKNKPRILETKSENYFRQKVIIDENFPKRRQKFINEIMWGCSFTCISCERALFARGVKTVNENFLSFLNENHLLQMVNLSEKFILQGKHFICFSCERSLKKKKMPKLCILNGLGVDICPETQGLTNLERQIIAKQIIFLKIRQLPKTRMDILNDRVVCVPIPDEEIMKTVNTLPRTKDNDGIVWVNLKRKIDMKNVHKSEMVRPYKVYEALQFLCKNHPSYKGIKIMDFEEWKNDLFINEEEYEQCNEEDPDIILSDDDVEMKDIEASNISVEDLKIVEDDLKAFRSLTEPERIFITSMMEMWSCPDRHMIKLLTATGKKPKKPKKKFFKDDRLHFFKLCRSTDDIEFFSKSPSEVSDEDFLLVTEDSIQACLGSLRDPMGSDTDSSGNDCGNETSGAMADNEQTHDEIPKLEEQ